MGGTAVKLLLDLAANGKDVPRITRIPVELVVRESTSKPREP
jgi:DNA-binding LacI/PurR family transcriptional regulator